MKLYELIVLAVGLSMDAFAISICKGLALGRIRVRDAAKVGLYFGFFQALMPAAGFFLGVGLRDYIESFDHWIAFGLLAFLGGRMIVEAIRGEEEDVSSALGVREMLLLAVATSIDALAAGISLSVLDVNIVWSVSLIGLITFTLSFVGVYVGGIFGEKWKRPAEIVGGAALVFLGVKILIEHLM